MNANHRTVAAAMEEYGACSAPSASHWESMGGLSGLRGCASYTRVMNITALKARVRQVKIDLIALGLAARDPRTPWYAKLIVVACVAYALSPVDVIPDFI